MKQDCDCKEFSCKEDCTRKHTHKGFFCNVCQPQPTTDEWNDELKDTFTATEIKYIEKVISSHYIKRSSLVEMIEGELAKIEKDYSLVISITNIYLYLRA